MQGRASRRKTRERNLAVSDCKEPDGLTSDPTPTSSSPRLRHLSRTNCKSSKNNDGNSHSQNNERLTPQSGEKAPNHKHARNQPFNTSSQNYYRNQKRNAKGQTAAQAMGKITGRWTDEEHQRFLEGIKLYKKNWKKVTQHVGTRISAQVRSHAQKVLKDYSPNYQRSQDCDDESSAVNDSSNGQAHDDVASKKDQTDTEKVETIRLPPELGQLIKKQESYHSGNSESFHGPKTEDVRTQNPNSSVHPAAHQLSIDSIIDLVKRNRTKSQEEQLAELDKFKKRPRTDLSDPKIFLEQSLPMYVSGSESQVRDRTPRFPMAEKAYAQKCKEVLPNEGKLKTETQQPNSQMLPGNYNFQTQEEQKPHHKPNFNPSSLNLNTGTAFPKFIARSGSTSGTGTPNISKALFSLAAGGAVCGIFEPRDASPRPGIDFQRLQTLLANNKNKRIWLDEKRDSANNQMQGSQDLLVSHQYNHHNQQADGEILVHRPLLSKFAPTSASAAQSSASPQLLAQQNVKEDVDRIISKRLSVPLQRQQSIEQQETQIECRPLLKPFSFQASSLQQQQQKEESHERVINDTESANFAQPATHRHESFGQGAAVRPVFDQGATSNKAQAGAQLVADVEKSFITFINKRLAIAKMLYATPKAEFGAKAQPTSNATTLHSRNSFSKNDGADSDPSGECATAHGSQSTCGSAFSYQQIVKCYADAKTLYSDLMELICNYEKNMKEIGSEGMELNQMQQVQITRLWGKLNAFKIDVEFLIQQLNHTLKNGWVMPSSQQQYSHNFNQHIGINIAAANSTQILECRQDSKQTNLNIQAPRTPAFGLQSSQFSQNGSQGFSFQDCDQQQHKNLTMTPARIEQDDQRSSHLSEQAPDHDRAEQNEASAERQLPFARQQLLSAQMKRTSPPNLGDLLQQVLRQSVSNGSTGASQHTVNPTPVPDAKRSLLCDRSSGASSALHVQISSNKQPWLRSNIFARGIGGIHFDTATKNTQGSSHRNSFNSNNK